MAVFEPSSEPLIALPAPPADVAFPTKQWQQAAAPDGVDVKRLDSMIRHATVDQPEEFGLTLAVLVVSGGQIVAEGYSDTADADTTLTSWSMAKSVVHALVGMLVADGELDIHDRARVPDWSEPDDPRYDITIDQLLRMASGLEFVEDYVDDSISHCIEMLFGAGQSNTAAYAAARPRVAGADTVFNYSSGTTNIVSRVVGEQMGTSDRARREWMNERLFDPIGMRSADPRFDDSGTFIGSSFLYATARDFARFGLLYLRDGVWDGQRLLPHGWVDYARTMRATDDDGQQYGAHWWLRPDGHGSFECKGYEAQRIRCVPAKDLVVVRLGKTVRELSENVDTWLDEIVNLFPTHH